MACKQMKTCIDQQRSPQWLMNRAGCAGLLSLLLIAGCAGRRGQSVQAAGDQPQDLGGTSLETLAQASSTSAPTGETQASPANSLEALVAQQTQDLERLTAAPQDQGIADPTGAWAAAPVDLNPSAVIAAGTPSAASPPATPSGSGPATGVSADAGADTSLESLAAAPLPGMPEAPATAMVDSSVGLEALATPEAAAPASDGLIINDALANKPVDEQVDAAATMFIDLLRQQAALSADPLRPYLMLSLLEAVRPGAMPTVISPDGQTLPLSEAEQRTVNLLRDVVSGVVQPPVAPAGSPAALTQIVDKLAEDAPLSIRGLQLCTQVRGFGQFTSVPRNEFLQGTPHTVIVYAELDGLRARDARSSDGTVTGNDPAMSGDTLAVELVQEINLYHDADGLRVWGSPEARIIETSRSKRRDFYTIHTVTLPANLSVGAYKLKLVVRDATSGSVSDANIPVKIVAGSALSAGPDDED